MKRSCPEDNDGYKPPKPIGKWQQIWRSALVICALSAVAACGGSTGGTTSDGTTQPTGDAIQAGLSVIGGLNGQAVINESYTSKLAVSLNDARNSISSYAVSNPTVGGAAPTVSSDGTVTWTPNAADIDTASLTVTINFSAGEPVSTTVRVPVSVYLKTLVVSKDIVVGQSTYSDDEGIYTVQLGLNPDATTPPSGQIKVYSYRSSIGAISYSVETTDPNVFGILTDSPVSSLTTGGLTTQANTSKEASNNGLLQRNEWNEFGIEAKGSILQSANNTYTLRSDSVFNLTSTFIDGVGYRNIKFNTAVKNQQILQVDSNCSLVSIIGKCNGTQAPVILVHGFNLSGIGGGNGTWGTLPSYLLKDQKHDVFEFRWVTYLRFEEAAGQLAKLINRVALKAGKKPIVIAHSFGGILSHLALSGQGIEWKENEWKTVKIGNSTAHEPTNVVDKLITFGSPIGGIYDGSGSTLTMPWGRQSGEVTINVCDGITCAQAGASDVPMDNFRDQMTAIKYPTPVADANGYFSWDTLATYRTRRADPKLMNYAETIARIGKVTTGIPAVDSIIPVLHGVKTIAFVGVGSSGLDPRSDPIGQLGDGLISLQGQIHPNDVDVLNSFFTRDDLLKGVTNIASNILNTKNSPNVPNMKYAFIGNMGHINMGINSDIRLHEFPEVYVNQNTNGAIDYCTGLKHTRTQQYLPVLTGIYTCDSSVVQITHPLVAMVDDTSFLASPVFDYVDNSIQVPSWKIYGKASKATLLTAANEQISFLLDIRDRSTGDRVLRTFAYATNDDGTFEIDLNSLVDATVTGFNRANLYLNLYLGDGVTYEVQRVTIQNLNQDQISMPEIILKPIASRAGMVDITGRVIDGQTTNVGIADAVIRIARGSGLTAASLQSVSNSNTSRTIGTDLSGNFSVPQLRPGVYSALVKKVGFVDEIQGSLTVSASGVLTLSLLPVFSDNQAAVTLRWGSVAGGATIASDLDSHFLRFSASNSLEYHINYSAKTGLNGDSLDRDDTDYEGPETISFTPQTAKSYIYYVRNYGGDGSIPGSNPLVIVRLGSQVYRFDLPVSSVNTAGYWRVFDMVNGIIRPCAVNCLQTSAPTAITTQAASLAPLSLDVSTYMTNLPTKH
jgi:hypothetical protein